FKKITPQSLRMSSQHKLKENDEIIYSGEVNGGAELLFFTDKFQVYKTRCADFDETKASVMGDYIPAKLGFDDGESIRFMAVTEDYSETLVMFFRNGKCAKVPLSSYETKTRRKKLSGAYSDLSELVGIFLIRDDADFVLKSTAGKALTFNTALVLPKAARDTQGVQVMRLTKAELAGAYPADKSGVKDVEALRIKSIPSAGTATDEDIDQITLM
ncbi:MAG TPA: topoisomerase IV, partial [Ruminococcaceae bacterium]|nr:topoisomerase IV [Oscillospiraceae bacterium]